MSSNPDQARCTRYNIAAGQWISLGTPVSSPNKTDCYDITEILLKVALNTFCNKINWHYKRGGLSWGWQLVEFTILVHQVWWLPVHGVGGLIRVGLLYKILIDKPCCRYFYTGHTFSCLYSNVGLSTFNFVLLKLIGHLSFKFVGQFTF